MKEIKDMWLELEPEEKKDCIGSIFAWLGLFGSVFMLSVIGG